MADEEEHALESRTVDTDKFNEWVGTNWRHGPCVVCGDDQWVKNPTAFMAIEYADSPLHSVQSFPFVVVTCTTCGYSLSISAKVAGVLKERVE